jgi:hypothetical protein
MSGRAPAVSFPSRSIVLASVLAVALVPAAIRAAPDVGTESRPGPPHALRAERVLDAATLDRLGVPHPTRIVFDANHCLYVLDAAARRIVKLDPAGQPLWDLGGYGDDDQSFSLPSDLAIDRRQSLLVLDRGKNALVAFDPAGHFLGVRSFGETVATDAADPGSRLLVDPFGDLWLLGARDRDLIPLDDRLERSRRSRFLAPEASAGSPEVAVYLPTSGGWFFDAADGSSAGSATTARSRRRSRTRWRRAAPRIWPWTRRDSSTPRIRAGSVSSCSTTKARSGSSARSAARACRGIPAPSP